MLLCVRVLDLKSLDKFFGEFTFEILCIFIFVYFLHNLQVFFLEVSQIIPFSEFSPAPLNGLYKLVLNSIDLGHEFFLPVHSLSK